MLETWRWYGSLDNIALSEIRQTGASGIVTALHEIPYGQVWELDTIAARRDTIKKAELKWSVCESLPISEDIKRGTGELDSLFANYRQSLSNLASAGIHTICYNFMPLIDWTRTDLQSPIASGGSCLRFEATKMAAFEIHMLGRESAQEDYPEEALQKAKLWFDQSSKDDQAVLLNSIMSGLPGAYDRYDIKGLRTALASYEGMDANDIRANYQRFLNEIIPCAEELGMRMCVHPDDPPRNILGLPRIVSNNNDIRWILSAYESQANGLTLCTGSLGAGPKNDLVEIAKEHADKIHFAHLRNVKKDTDGSFEEAAHLEGDTNLVEVCSVLLQEEQRRKETGREDWEIPFRPDHGHELLSDSDRKTFPGYPLIGRLRGLAELRGVICGINGKL
jgi:mannonate dehydratase